MAVSVFKTFTAGEVLTASDLNSSFTQITDGGEDLAWPATKAKDFNSQSITNALRVTAQTVTSTSTITSGGDVISDTDSTDDIGTTGVRWANLFADDVTLGTNLLPDSWGLITAGTTFDGVGVTSVTNGVAGAYVVTFDNAAAGTDKQSVVAVGHGSSPYQVTTTNDSTTQATISQRLDSGGDIVATDNEPISVIRYVFT